MEEITQLAQYGLSGVCIALVVLIGYLSSKAFKFSGNHVDHNTEAWIKNTEALTKLSGKIEADTKAQKEMTGVLRDIQGAIKDKRT